MPIVHVDIFFGDNKDVLKRMIGSIKNKRCEIALRITADDILVDPIYLDKNIDYHCVV